MVFALLVIAPPVLQIIVDNFGPLVGPEITAAIVALIAVIVALAKTAAQIMAVPGVVEFSRKFLNGYFAPDPAPPATPEEKTPEQLAAEEVDLTPPPADYEPRH